VVGREGAATFPLLCNQSRGGLLRKGREMKKKIENKKIKVIKLLTVLLLKINIKFK
jgi:hypothetical protein